MFRYISRRRQASSIALSLIACAGVLLGAVYLLRTIMPLDAGFLGTALALYMIGAGLIFGCARAHLDTTRFGRANLVTLIRWSQTAVLAAFITQSNHAGILWAAAVLAVIALLLDGVDGWLARRFSEASDFGARFDMETDAVLILVLAALVWRFDRAGLWILAAGFLRYGFVAASRIFDCLAQPLPRSRRRQTICVLQVVSLIVCLLPVLSRNMTQLIAASGLVALTVSFWLDIVWAVRHRATSTYRVTA